MKSWSLNLLEPSGPHRACYGTALPLPQKWANPCYNWNNKVWFHSQVFNVHFTKSRSGIHEYSWHNICFILALFLMNTNPLFKQFVAANYWLPALFFMKLTRDTHLMQQFIYYYKQLYMFRASICPSSGVLGCIRIMSDTKLTPVHKTTHRLIRTSATTPSAEQHME